MTLGERIKKARKDMGYTQEELANELNVSYQAVSAWETGVYAPDTYNLIELAKKLDVSLSYLVEDKGAYEFVTKKALYSWEHMRTFVKSSANALKLKNSIKAVDYATKAHKGQFRKNSDIPYIYHPLNLACHCLAMGIKDDAIIAACLLHDVLEDTDVTVEDLKADFEKEVVELVVLMTHGKSEDKTIRENIIKKYYKDLAKNPKAALIKCVDRCNNLTTMSYGLSRDRIYRYIRESEEYILPLLKVIKNDYNDAAWLLSYHIQSMLDIYKRLL